MASAHYQELLWDYLYGLLDEPEVRAVRAHLESCAACRAALAEAEVQQQLLARAARVIHEVPAFMLPGQDQETAAAQTSSSAAAPEVAPATRILPLSAPKPRRS